MEYFKDFHISYLIIDEVNRKEQNSVGIIFLNSRCITMLMKITISSQANQSCTWIDNLNYIFSKWSHKVTTLLNFNKKI